MSTNKLPEFITAYGQRKTCHTPSGDKFEFTYGYEVNKAGSKILTITGETDVYEAIQENLEETKIENILKRVAMGDTTVFRPDAIYADLTETPKNLIEAQAAIGRLKTLWSGLNNDIKRKYDFDVEKFIGQSGSTEWLKDMGFVQEQTQSIQQAVAASAPVREKEEQINES